MQLTKLNQDKLQLKELSTDRLSSITESKEHYS